MCNQTPYRVLGLDPGIASCGFALIDLANQEILEMGSHLFDAPQEDKTKTSLAVVRRNARSVRRNNLRTKNRLNHCLKLLVQAGMVPADADKGWFQSRKGDKPVLKLRAKGLDVCLTDREFAQVLYSLCGNRGYIPHGEGAPADVDDVEGRKVLKAIGANEQAMKNGGYRTVGEMLNLRGRSRNKAGDYELCVRNSQIQDEVRALFAAQRSLKNARATRQLEKSYLECLTWEKKTLDHDEKTYACVGGCSYFPEEKRAALADVSSELCRACERFGHVVIVRGDGSERRLTAKERDRYLGILFTTDSGKMTKAKVTYKAIRKDLDLSAKDVFKGIDRESEKSTEPFEPKAWRVLLKSGLSQGLLKRMLDDRDFGDDVCEALTFASSEDSLAQRLAELDVTDEEMEQITRVPFSGKAFKGYGKRGRKALGMLLDAFEGGAMTLIDAEDASGLLEYRLSKEGERSALLPPYDVYDSSCRNPVVLRAMGRMRKIVNSIVRIYGVPDEIHIELGRELKRSGREKKLISKRQRESEKTNKRLRELAAERLGKEPSEIPGRLVKKMALREEQGAKDPYTDQPIDLDVLIADDRAYEIDHILPYSRTCDDGRANKVLVLEKSNRDKGSRTPYEWMTSGEPEAPCWDEFRNRVLATVKDSRKQACLLNQDLGKEQEERFLARNLNDTRYMSVAVKNYLEETLQFPEGGKKRRVYAVAGGATATLRHYWGLGQGVDGSKDRSDGRHHAVDAAIIAACAPSTVQAVALERERRRREAKEEFKERLRTTQPWPTFAEDVRERYGHVVPTRMVSHGVTGRVVQDTLYHVVGCTEDKGRYPILRAGGKDSKKGNVIFGEDDSARIVDGMAFLRLWLDADARPKGKVKGKWYAEPVYYADIPAVKDGTYVPRAAEIHVARVNWKPLPETALASKPVVLFRNDVVEIDGHIVRFAGFDISGCRLEFSSLLAKGEVKGVPSFGKWGRDTAVKVLQEDCLGHCYDGLKFDFENSTFEAKNSVENG